MASKRSQSPADHVVKKLKSRYSIPYTTAKDDAELLDVLNNPESEEVVRELKEDACAQCGRRFNACDKFCAKCGKELPKPEAQAGLVKMLLSKPSRSNSEVQAPVLRDTAEERIQHQTPIKVVKKTNRDPQVLQKRTGSKVQKSDTSREVPLRGSIFRAFMKDAPKHSPQKSAAQFHEKAEDAPTDRSDKRAPKFNENAEELEATSSAFGSGRSVRNRMNTGYAKKVDIPKGKGLQFGESSKPFVSDPKKTARENISDLKRHLQRFPEPADTADDDDDSILVSEDEEDDEEARHAWSNAVSMKPRPPPFPPDKKLVPQQPAGPPPESVLPPWRRQKATQSMQSLRIVTYGMRFQLDLDDAHMYVDARCFRDPGACNLRSHDGRYPQIMRRIVDHKNFVGWLTSVRDGLQSLADNHDNEDGPLIVAIYCKSGQHRSVALANILQHIANETGMKCEDVDVDHVTLNCCECLECNWSWEDPGPIVSSVFEDALYVWLNEYVLE